MAVTEQRQPYRAEHLAVIVPTKDRPGKLANLLESLASQDQPPGRILVIDGGRSVVDVVARYAGRLRVEHHVCQPPGQIRQRNLGISLVDDRTPLVASLDDDIVFEPGAVAAMLAFWNGSEPDTAGVSFNIVNTPPEPRNWVRDLFLMSGPAPGKVLKSGAATSNCQIQSDIRADWLCGGATVWRLDILREHPHREIHGKWAIAEDLVFSYPIGKQHPLYVCASARVRHEHVFDYSVKRRHRFHGETQTLWLMHFVSLNVDLSLAAFLWMILGSAGGRLLVGGLTLNRDHLEFAIGQILGVGRGCAAMLGGRDPVRALDRGESLRGGAPRP